MTRWTDKTELFAEYPPLVVGGTSRFAIHLTRLDSFKALTEGNVEVRLQGGSGQPEVFRVDAPSRPGIFGVDVKPAQAGKRELVIVLKAKGLSDEHRVGEVDVHPNAEAAQAAAGGGGEDAPGISFLKEQQWSLDFGTAVVKEQAVRESIRVPARLEARPGGAADVVAPIDGRLTRVVDVPLGADVSRGQELARLLPPASAPGDLPQLQRARAEAQDRGRAGDARPGARRTLDERRCCACEATRRGSFGRGTGQGPSCRSRSQPGAIQRRASRRRGGRRGNVPRSGAGERRDRPAQRHDGCQLFPRERSCFGWSMHRRSTSWGRFRKRRRRAPDTRARPRSRSPGQPDRLPAGRLISIGKVLESPSRTLPITFALDNRTLGIPVGQAIVLHLLMDTTPPRPVVPAAAVVDDAGRPIVFVQREGETFERRAVTLGPRSGDVVQITEGVKPGDRVVTKGAYLVRLASLSTSVPAHGHVH